MPLLFSKRIKRFLTDKKRKGLRPCSLSAGFIVVIRKRYYNAVLSNNHLLMDRTHIPAELKRRVLVEAGHRCAIHTCKHPAVDVHHIIPWSQSQEHSYENLIALCPNCHRRADSGEIDRQSLLAYKARVRARFDLPNGRDESDQQKRLKTRMDRSKHSGEQRESPYLWAPSRVPGVHGFRAEVEEVNNAVAALAFDEVQTFRSYTLLAAPHLFRPDSLSIGSS